MKIFKKTILILILALVIPFAVKWTVDIIKCEMLTKEYGGEYVDIVLEDMDCERLAKIKVLEYSDNFAKIYYVLNHYKTMKPAYGFLVEIKDGKRTGSEHCVWSSMGSADGFIWPYGR